MEEFDGNFECAPPRWSGRRARLSVVAGKERQECETCVLHDVCLAKARYLKWYANFQAGRLASSRGSGTHVVLGAPATRSATAAGDPADIVPGRGEMMGSPKDVRDVCSLVQAAT